MQPKISREEFKEAWNRFGSVAKVAQFLKIE